MLTFVPVFAGDQSQGAASPVPLKKDVENMEKGRSGVSPQQDDVTVPPSLTAVCPPAEELQKVLLEQIDFRRRLEQEFHALKGTSPFPVFRESSLFSSFAL